MMLRRNEVSIGQLELLATTVNWGVTDFLSVQAGAVVPLLFVSLPNSLHALVAVKTGGRVLDRLYLAGGAQVAVIPFLLGNLAAVGLAFGTVTYGVADAHVSLSVGVPFGFSGGSAGLRGAALPANSIFALSGHYRVARNVAIVTENWIAASFSATSGGVQVADALALRLLSEHLAVDVGL